MKVIVIREGHTAFVRDENGSSYFAQDSLLKNDTTNYVYLTKEEIIELAKKLQEEN